MDRSTRQHARLALGVLVVVVLGPPALAQPPVFGPAPIADQPIADQPVQAGDPPADSYPQQTHPTSPSSKALGSPEAPAAYSSQSESQALAGDPHERAMPSIWRTMLPLGGVIGVILLLAAMVRKSARTGGGLLGAMGAGGRAPSGVLSVLGRYPVGGGHQFVLLKIDRRVLLLAQHTGWRARSKATGFRVLCEMSDPEEVASILLKTQDERGASIAKRFGDFLDEQPPPSDALVDLTARRVDRSPGGDVVELSDHPARPQGSALGSLRERLSRLRNDAPWTGTP